MGNTVETCCLLCEHRDIKRTRISLVSINKDELNKELPSLEPDSPSVLSYPINSQKKDHQHGDVSILSWSKSDQGSKAISR